MKKKLFIGMFMALVTMCVSITAFAQTPSKALADYISTLKKDKTFNDAYIIDIDNDYMPELISIYKISGTNEYTMRTFEYENDNIKERKNIYSDDLNGFTSGKAPAVLYISASPYFYAVRDFVKGGNGKIYLLDHYTHANFWGNDVGAKNWNIYTLFEITQSGLKCIECYENTYFQKRDGAPKTGNSFSFSYTDYYSDSNFDNVKSGISESKFNERINYYNSLEKLPVHNGEKALIYIAIGMK